MHFDVRNSNDIGVRIQCRVEDNLDAGRDPDVRGEQDLPVGLHAVLVPLAEVGVSLHPHEAKSGPKLGFAT